MSKIILNENDLKSRLNRIQNLLKPLRKKSRLTPCYSRYPQDKIMIWGVNEKDPYNKDIDEWRITTVKNIFSANYQEHWEIIDAKRNFKLIKIIFHIYKKNELYKTEDELYICLHCDPLDKLLYKKSPHLHLKAAEPPIPNAHIALNISNIEKVLNSIDTLTESFKNCILMVKNEILDKF